MEGRMEGKRTSGRRRVGMIDNLREGTLFEILKRKAQDRGGWRRDTRDLSNGRALLIDLLINNHAFNSKNMRFYAYFIFYILRSDNITLQLL